MSKSVEYEQITRLVFQTLVNQDEALNIDVQHDVTLPGKFLEHQVDVYWEVETGGIKQRTVIECKDWNRPLEQEKLLAFRSKLEDLYSPVGVMVTLPEWCAEIRKQTRYLSIPTVRRASESPISDDRRKFWNHQASSSGQRRLVTHWRAVVDYVFRIHLTTNRSTQIIGTS